MRNQKEQIDHCLSRYESGESVSKIAASLGTDEYEIRLIMSNDPYRYDYADFVRARHQNRQLQKIKKIADDIALKQIEKIETAIRSANISQEDICNDIDDVRNVVDLAKRSLSSLDSSQSKDENGKYRPPFKVMITKTYVTPDGTDCQQKTETMGDP